MYQKLNNAPRLLFMNSTLPTNLAAVSQNNPKYTAKYTPSVKLNASAQYVMLIYKNVRYRGGDLTFNFIFYFQFIFTFRAGLTFPLYKFFILQLILVSVLYTAN